MQLVSRNLPRRFKPLPYENTCVYNIQLVDVGFDAMLPRTKIDKCFDLSSAIECMI
jgi:hypothetical protein